MKMKRIISNLNNEEGSAIVIALIILVLLTMIGISATDNTVIELQIVRNEAIYRQNFYKAEGAIIEAAQIMEDTTNTADLIPATTTYIWLKDSSTLDNMTVVGDWNAGNSQLSNNMNDAGDIANNTSRAAINNGIAGGASLDMTGTNSYDFSVYGLFDSTSGQGRSLIFMGYRKRF